MNTIERLEADVTALTMALHMLATSAGPDAAARWKATMRIAAQGSVESLFLFSPLSDEQRERLKLVLLTLGQEPQPD